VKTPEGYEKSDVDKFLKSIGAWYCCPTTFGYGPSGTPDRVVCHNGKFISLEIKREGKGPTVLQNRRMEAIVAAGGIAIWGTAEKVIAELKALTVW
jgi:hypothetical protein